MRRDQFISLMLGALFFATWYNKSISVGGKDILYTGEIIAYLIFLAIVSLRGWKLAFPKAVRVPLILITIYFIGHIGYSFVELSAGQALSKTRDFLVFPLLGLLMGYNLQLVTGKDQLEKSILSYFKFLLVVAVANAILSFKPMQEYGLIERPDGMILSFLVFGYILSMIKRERSLLNPLRLLLALILIFFTSSRGVYLAVVATSGVIFLLNMRHLSTRVLRVAAFGTSGFTVLIIALLSFDNPVRDGLNKFTGDILDLTEGDLGSYGDEFNTLGGRYFLYQSVFELGMESPILGKGLGFAQKSWYLGGDYDTYREKSPHNYYLMLWYKIGLVGITLFVFFYYRLLKTLRKLNPTIFFYSIATLMYAGVDVILFGNKPAIIAFFLICGMGLATNKARHV